MTGIPMRNETLPIIHVYPENDDREHTLDSSGKCWCKPERTKIGQYGVRITHNSKDGREFVESELGELLDADKTWAHKLIE
jgi:Tfp pilus assembly protein PilZ